MSPRPPLHWLLLAIAIATLTSGIVQLVKPDFVLRIVAAEATETSKHLFGIVGMFMALFGGMLTQVLLSNQQPAVVFVWAGLQKVGASAAVAIGITRHIFSPLAIGISVFDLTSGILIFVYLRSLTRQAGRR